VLLIIALGLLVIVALQWFTQQVGVKLWGPIQATFHRDEWPAFYWTMIGIEVVVAGLSLVGWFFG
jgi:hypothetical protein